MNNFWIKYRRYIYIAGLTILVNTVLFFLFPLLHYYKTERLRAQQETKGKTINLTEISLQEKKKKEKKKEREKPQEVRQKQRERPDRFQLKLGMAGGGGAQVLDESTKNIIYREGEVERVPQKIGGRNPVFPPAAAAAGVKGHVEMELLVDESGAVTRVTVINESSTEGYGFREASINSAWTYRFRPALIKNIPVKCLLILVHEY